VAFEVNVPISCHLPSKSSLARHTGPSHHAFQQRNFVGGRPAEALQDQPLQFGIEQRQQAHVMGRRRNRPDDPTSTKLRETDGRSPTHSPKASNAVTTPATAAVRPPETGIRRMNRGGVSSSAAESRHLWKPTRAGQSAWSRGDASYTLIRYLSFLSIAIFIHSAKYGNFAAYISFSVRQSGLSIIGYYRHSESRGQ